MTTVEPNVDDLRSKLDRFGGMDMFMANGGRAHVHKHDVEIMASGRIVIDSRDGYWELNIDDIEAIHPDDSYYEPPA